MKFLYSFILCVSMMHQVYAQQKISVRGVVLGVNQQPVAHAHIDVNSVCVESDEAGVFLLELPEAKSYVVKIHKNGFLSFMESYASLAEDEAFYLFQTEEELPELVIDTYHLNTDNSRQVNRKDLLDNYSGSFSQALANQVGLESSAIGSQNGRITMRSLGFNRVAIAENGIKQEGQQWGADHGLEIDALQVEQVEIKKGTGTIEYGSDAIAGVVAINNELTPEEGWHGSGLSSFRSNNLSWANSWNLSYKKNKSYFKAKASYTRYGDFYVPTDEIVYLNTRIPIYEGRMTNTAGKETSFMAQWGHISKASKNIVSISHFRNQSGFFAGAHGIPSVEHTRPRENNYLIELPQQQANHTKINWHHQQTDLHNKWNFHATYQRNHRQELSGFHTHFPNQPRPANDTVELDFLLHVFDARITYQQEWNLNHTTKFGVNAQTKNNSIAGYSFLLPKYNQQNLGVFVLHQWEFSNEQMLSFGTRFDWAKINIASFFDQYMYDYLIKRGYSTQESQSFAQRSQPLNRNFQQGNVSVGYTFHLNKNYHSSVTLASNFRLPTPMELSANGIHHGAFRHEQGNSNLDAEKGWAMDWNHHLKGKNWELNGSAYTYYFTNYIFLKPSGIFSILPHGGQIYQYDQSQALIAGVELDANYTYKQWNFATALEYIYTQQFGADAAFALPFSTPTNGLFSVKYTQKTNKKLDNIDYQVHYKHYLTQNRIAQNELKTPGFGILNLSLQAVWSITQNLQPLIQLEVQNALNTKYYEHISFYRPLNIPGLGRSINLKTVINF